MANRSKTCKFSIALAICCGVIGGIAIAPVAVSAVFALVALFCLLCCVVVYLVGLFIWLFSAGQANVFGFAASLADFGLGLFNFITPIANFSFRYVTPIAGWIALGVGVLGIIVSSIGISKANKARRQAKLQNAPLTAPELPDATEEFPEGKHRKKKKAKKKRTEKGACVASLIVCIVFSLVAGIALIVAAMAVNMA